MAVLAWALLAVQVGWCLSVALHDCVYEVGEGRLIGMGLVILSLLEAAAAAMVVLTV